MWDGEVPRGWTLSSKKSTRTILLRSSAKMYADRRRSSSLKVWCYHKLERRRSSRHHLIISLSLYSWRSTCCYRFPEGTRGRRWICTISSDETTLRLRFTSIIDWPLRSTSPLSDVCFRTQSKRGFGCVMTLINEIPRGPFNLLGACCARREGSGCWRSQEMRVRAPALRAYLPTVRSSRVKIPRPWQRKRSF